MESAVQVVRMCLNTYTLEADHVVDTSTVKVFEGNTQSSPRNSVGSHWGPRKSRTIDSDASAVWRPVCCPEVSWREKYKVRMFYRRSPFEQHGDAHLVRLSMHLPFDARLVASLLADASEFIQEALVAKRHQLPQDTAEKLQVAVDSHYLHQLQSATVVQQVNLCAPHEAHTQLLDCVLGTPTAPHVSVRLWMLRTIRILPDERTEESVDGQGFACLIACTGVPPVASRLQDESESQDTRRLGHSHSIGAGARTATPQLVHLQPSGVLLRDAGDGHTEVNLSALLGKDCIKLVSGDMLGEELLFWRSIRNLLYVLEHVCPLPPSFTHSLLSQVENCMTYEGDETWDLSSPLSRSLSPSSQSTDSEHWDQLISEELQVKLLEDGREF